MSAGRNARAYQFDVVNGGKFAAARNTPNVIHRMRRSYISYSEFPNYIRTRRRMMSISRRKGKGGKGNEKDKEKTRKEYVKET
jgi:hypothetical protein